MQGEVGSKQVLFQITDLHAIQAVLTPVFRCQPCCVPRTILLPYIVFSQHPPLRRQPCSSVCSFAVGASLLPKPVRSKTAARRQ